jgi:hypothetical protein
MRISAKLRYTFTSPKFYRTLRDYSGAIFASIAAANIVLWRSVLLSNLIIGIVAIFFIFAISFVLSLYFYNRLDKVVNKRLRIKVNRLYMFNRNFRIFKNNFIQVELGIIAAGLYALSNGNIVISAAFSAIFAIAGFFAIYLAILLINYIHLWKIRRIKNMQTSG